MGRVTIKGNNDGRWKHKILKEKDKSKQMMIKGNM